MDRLRKRLRLEIVLAALSAVMCALTLVVPEWIEVLTGGWEPDSGSGALEWIIAGVLLLAAVVSAVLARRDYRQLAAHRS